MKKKYFTLIFSGLLLFIKIPAFAQAGLHGPTCIIPGTVYEYITDNLDSTQNVQICIHGGTIIDSSGNNTCEQKVAPRRILVVWNDSASDRGTLLLTSSSDTSQLAVSFTQPLQPGSIDSISRLQFVYTDSLPAIIACSPDSGGSCSPIYAYQWQQSSDGLSWTDMPEATDQRLTITSFLLNTAYFRRKVTESGSGTIAYSDVAAVFVNTRN